MSSYRITCIDHSGEKTSTTYPLPQIDATNHDNVVGVRVPALKAAHIAATRGNVVSESINHSSTPSVPSVPSDKDAQREIGLEVTWYDTVNPAVKGSFTLGCVDLPLFAEAGTDLVDLEEVAPAALIVALEASCESPAGNPIEVTKMRIVGRRN